MSTVPNNVNVYQDTPNQVIVNQDSPNQIIVRSSGAAGNTRRHVHTQASPSTDWVVIHTLGGKPSVTVVDSADTLVIGEVKYDSNTQVTVSFTSAFSGFAYLT
jgi:RNA:NAD 2'-phosphotransferase (TPT1/KptA family)